MRRASDAEAMAHLRHPGWKDCRCPVHEMAKMRAGGPTVDSGEAAVTAYREPAPDWTDKDYDRELTAAFNGGFTMKRAEQFRSDRDRLRKIEEAAREHALQYTKLSTQVACGHTPPRYDALWQDADMTYLALRRALDQGEGSD